LNNMKTIHELAKMLEKGETTSVALTEECLRIADTGSDSTRAFLLIDRENALAAARASDARRAMGQSLGVLDGIPVAIKDCIVEKGKRATAGSKILKTFISPFSATVVEKLVVAGAVPIGRTNMDEFAMGSSTENSAFGPSRNPWDLSRVPGGSSGGSAVAVTEGSAVFALGTDTGGSIRQPAALCGVTGLKPTYGRVSRYGLMAMASSLDQAGPFTKTAQDAATVLRVIEGADVKDSTSVELEDAWKIPEQLMGNVKGMRIGLPKEYFVEGMDAGVSSAVREAVKVLENAGAVISEVSLPHAEQALAVYYILMPCEVSANLSRYDGIRYGSRVDGKTLMDVYKESRGKGFGVEARRRIMLGTYALSAGYYDAYYLKAQKVRRLIAEDFARVFADVDCILTPTTPTTAWKIGEKGDDPVTMYLSDIYTVSVNVAGLPAISVPCGFAGGMPVGLQFIGKQFDEKTILEAAHGYQLATDWHTKTPHSSIDVI
jgi:aspartyl-tRNA(Asn)/glutamyl-tRNA(Gln) amidotransferase subunit A